MRVILATTLLFGLAACDGAPSASVVTIEEARVTLPAVGGRPGAAYFTIISGAQPIRIAAVTTPRAARIELHDMSMAGNTMRMGPLQNASIPAKAELRFAPGGKHAMIFGLDPALQPGDRLPLTFTFDGAPAITVEAEVQAPGGGSPTH